MQSIAGMGTQRWRSNLNLEVDYYDIKVTNAIGAVDPNVTLNNCVVAGDAASCALIMRTANGFINEIDGTLGISTASRRRASISSSTTGRRRRQSAALVRRSTQRT